MFVSYFCNELYVTLIFLYIFSDEKDDNDHCADFTEEEIDATET
jgi:hypothetical protein